VRESEFIGGALPEPEVSPPRLRYRGCSDKLARWGFVLVEVDVLFSALPSHSCVRGEDVWFG
jgi:hypothetical protein